MTTLRLGLLAAVLLACGYLKAATLTLAWNPSPNTNVTYRLYSSVGAGEWTLSAATTITTATAVASDTERTRYYVVAYNSGGESAPSNVVTNTPTAPPLNGLSFEAESGVITRPFFSNGSVLQQNEQTGAVDGGRATYQFTVTNSGVFTVRAWVNAPSADNDSFFVTMDAEPNDANIWDVPLTSGIEERTVQWRGESAPHQFVLSVGLHMLVVGGREPGVQLDKLTIVPGSVIPPPQPPPAPTNLRSVKVQGTRWDLSWNSVFTAATEVERSVFAGPFQRIETVAPGTQHTSVTAKPKTDYAFRVRSVNAAGASAYSNTIIVYSRN